MPRASIRLEIRIGGVGERPMRSLAIRERGRAVRRRSHQRMPEPHVHTDLHEPGVDRRPRFRRIDSEPARGAPHDHRITGRFGRGHGQEPLRRRRELGDSTAEALLDLTRDRQRRRHAEPAGQLGPRQPTRPLPERQRIRARLGHDAVAHPFVERHVQHRVEERLRVSVAESLDDQLAERREVGARLAGGEHQSNRIGQEPPRDERERLGRLAVEPVGIVDDTEHRALVGRHRQQAQDGEADQEPVGRSSVRQSERRPRRVALRIRQRVQAVEQRRTQLVERGERELHLGLDAGGADHLASHGRVHQVLEQRALADAGITTHHEHAALPGSNRVDQLVECSALLRAADEFGGRRGCSEVNRAVDRSNAN